MGFVMLGIATLTTIGIQAAIFGMVAHGVITGMLFFCVGSIYDRYHTREIAEIGGGMAERMPKLAGVFAFVAIASLGPARARRVLGRGHGAARRRSARTRRARDSRRPVPRVHGRGRRSGRSSRPGYFLWMLQRVNMGTMPGQVEGARASATSSPSSGSRGCRCWSSIVVLGLFPRLIFGVTEEAVRGVMAALGGG